MSGRARIDLKLLLEGAPVPSETTYAWAGPYVLSVHTVIPRPDLAIELHSTFTGHPGTPTAVAQLTLGPPGHGPVLTRDEQPREDLLLGDVRTRDAAGGAAAAPGARAEDGPAQDERLSA